ncbi:MAG: fructofuranosidase/invertase [Bacteroidetes bacterium]|nr:MAG: fructofuranosidase/invertase [Bacteroidota bacterium]
MQTAYKKSVAMLAEALSEKGFLASTTQITNYRRIWARDGTICGLAGLLTSDPILTEGLKKTLQTLADHQTDLGHIPSNVYFEGEKAKISLGGLAGRADTIAWFVIGVCNYAKLTDNQDFANKLKPKLDKGLRLMQAWEFNNRGLMYVPQSGDWADEYILHGYVFYDQVLRLWALRCYADLFDNQEVREQAENLTELLEVNFWIDPANANHKSVYHEKAFEIASKSGTYPYFLASLAPSGYNYKFDPFGNAIALMLGLGKKNASNLIDFADKICAELPLNLLPCFWKPVQENDKEWIELQNNNKYEFRNLPYEFHNGGTWTMVNGFWGMALCQNSEKEKAKTLLKAINSANSLEDWGFYENFHSLNANGIGTKFCTWSAAGAVLLQETLNEKKLYLGK